MNRFVRVILCALPSTLAAAQAPIDDPDFLHEVSFPWDQAAHGVPGTITRLVSGDVTGDRRPDVFVRGGAAGDSILFLYAPFLGSATSLLAQTANDFDLAVGDGPGGVDVLVTVGSTGLRRMFYNGSTFVPELVTPQSAAWTDALIVRCGNVNAAGGIDYVGLEDDGTEKSVIYRREDGNETSFTVGARIIDIQLLHWANAPVLQAALLTHAGVQIYNLETGLPIDTFANSGLAGDAIAVVRVGTTGPDRLMWASRAPQQDAVLKQLRRAGPKLEATLQLDRDDVVSMERGASNGAGDSLVVCFAGSHSPLHLTNQADRESAPLFSLDHSHTVSMPPIVQTIPPTYLVPGAATPIYRDLDNDRRADLLLAVSTTAGASFVILRDTPGGSEFGSGQFFIGDPDVPDPVPLLDNGPGYAGPDELSFAFRFESIDTKSTHVEIVVWDQPTISVPIEPIALRRYLLPLNGAQPTQKLWASGIRLDLEFPGESCIDEIRWLEVRQIEWNGSKVVDAGPTYTAALANGWEWNSLNPGDELAYPWFDVFDPVTGNTACPEDDPWPLRIQTRRRRSDPPPSGPLSLPPVSEGGSLSVVP